MKYSYQRQLNVQESVTMVSPQMIEHVFLRKIFEKWFDKWMARFRLQLSRLDDNDADSHLLQQYGTLLAKSLPYLNSMHDCQKQLDILFTRTLDEKYYCQKNSDLIINVHQLRFLTSFSQIELSKREEARAEIDTSFDSFFTLKYGNQIDTSPPGRRNPPPLVYEYLVALTDMYIAFQDTTSYSILHKYCSIIIEKKDYNQLCKLHRYIGFFAATNPSFGDIYKDILIQNLFRINFLRWALQNDPWRFLEQVFISQFFLPDQSIFRFATTLLIKQIEKFSQSTRFSTEDSTLHEGFKLTHVLLCYLRCKTKFDEGILATTEQPDDLIWNRTDNAISIVNGVLHPHKSPVKNYSQLTFIAEQIGPKTLFLAPDSNWSKKYQKRSHDHVKPFNLGAETVLTSDLPKTFNDNQQFIQVRNTYTAMLKLALRNRKSYMGRIVGITGSVGKTSTAAMLNDVLKYHGKTFKNISAFNHQTGVPKSVANIPLDSDFAVLEMGMGRPLSILLKTKLVRPHIAVVVEIQHDHMEFHDSIQSVIETKMEIIEGLEPGGTVILNRDSAHFSALLGIAEMKKIQHIITFGEHPSADIRAKKIKLFPDHSVIQLEICGKSTQYTLSLPGIHMAHNSLAVWAVLHALGVNTEEAVAPFSQLQHTSGRNEIFNVILKDDVKIQVIDDSFNANPSSMRSSFHLLSLLQPEAEGRRIMIMGDMGELGTNSKKYHEDLAEDINQSKIDIVLSIGTLTRHLTNKIDSKILHKHFPSTTELQNNLLESLRHGDIVAIKGSARGRGMEGIVKYLKRFSSGR